jgi:hypothetical protein
MMKTENVELKFAEGAVREVAKVASEINTSLQNIGARRLHTIMVLVSMPFFSISLFAFLYPTKCFSNPHLISFIYILIVSAFSVYVDRLAY